MANVMQSLFNIDLEQRQPVATDPLQAVSGLIGRTGASLRQNITGAFGQQTPRQALNSIIQQTQQEADLSTPEGLITLANNLNQLPQFAGIALAMRQEAADLSQQKQKTQADVFAKGAQAQKDIIETQAKLRQVNLDEQLRQELSQLPENATEEQYNKVLMKYGSPDKVIASLQSGEARRERMAFQREMQQQRIDMARDALNLRIEAADLKKMDKEEARQSKLQGALGVADNVISVAQTALKQVSGFTAGMLGRPLSALGVPAAVDLEENLKTIQANLGFKELQAMRDASPTGGALGQVALKELEFLQAALTSLSNRQSPEQLNKNLNKVVKHYTNWRNVVSGQMPAEVQPSAAEVPTAPTRPIQSVAPVESTQGWKILNVR
jgi:hypothetical protein